MQESNFQLTPGQMLSAAREARSLTRLDVANHLRLSEQAVNDIEHDAFAQLGVRTFVRGYLSSYARVVGIPEEKILHALDESGLMPATAAKPGIVGGGAPVTNVTRQYARIPSSRYAFMGVVAVVIIAGFALWEGKKTLSDKIQFQANNTPSTEVVLPQQTTVIADNHIKNNTTSAVSNTVPNANTLNDVTIEADAPKNNTPKIAHSPVNHHKVTTIAANNTTNINPNNNNGFVRLSKKQPPMHTTYTLSPVTTNDD